jgi:hypothetical protein
MYRTDKKRIFFTGLLLITLININYAGNLSADEENFYKNKGYTILYGQKEGVLPGLPYLICDTLKICKGTSLVFESGALISLLENACIIVEGSLYCKGANRGLITFAGLSADKYYQKIDTQKEFRWTGIVLLDSAKAELRYCSITGSRQGIEISHPGCSILCENVALRDNVPNSFSFAGRNVPVKEGNFFSIDLTGRDALTSLSVFKEEQQEKEIRKSSISTDKKKSPVIKPLRWAFGITAGAGFVAGIAGWAVNSYYYDKYLHATDPSKYSPQDVSRFEKYAKTGKIAGIVGAAISGAGLAGFTLTMVF